MAHIGIYALNLSKQELINKQVFCIWVYLGNLIFKYRIRQEEEAHFGLWGKLCLMSSDPPTACQLLSLSQTSRFFREDIGAILSPNVYYTLGGALPESLLLPDLRNKPRSRLEIKVARFNNNNKNVKLRRKKY